MASKSLPRKRPISPIVRAYCEHAIARACLSSTTPDIMDLKVSNYFMGCLYRFCEQNTLEYIDMSVTALKELESRTRSQTSLPDFVSGRRHNSVFSIQNIKSALRSYRA